MLLSPGPSSHKEHAPPVMECRDDNSESGHNESDAEVKKLWEEAKQAEDKRRKAEPAGSSEDGIISTKVDPGNEDTTLVVNNLTGKIIGKLAYQGKPMISSVQIQCKSHPKCIKWINIVKAPPQAAMIAWLRAGNCPAEKHKGMFDEIAASYM